MCSHSTRQYFYSVYTNSRICRFCWTDEPRVEEPVTPKTQIAEAFEDAVAEKADRELEPVLRSMLAVAKASVQAAEAMEEFLTAHKEGQARGVGVVVVRCADGTTTSTPNVFVPAGTAIFMDEPGNWQPPLEFPELSTPDRNVTCLLPRLPEPTTVLQGLGTVA